MATCDVIVIAAFALFGSRPKESHYHDPNLPTLENTVFTMTRITASFLRALALFCWPMFLPAVAEPSTLPKGWFVWPVFEPASGTALDTAGLNSGPAGVAGRITAKDGGFITAEGHPIRFFGVNIAGSQAFPSADEAEKLARLLAKGGINIARLHHLDNPWAVESGGSLWSKGSSSRREIDPAQIDKIHRLIATLARHGIYTNLNLKVSKTLGAADGFPDSVSQIPHFQKRVDFFDRRMIELQKEFARFLLTKKNPYTGYAPVDDPAVAIIEINNENSLLGFFTRDLGRGTEAFPEPFRTDLRLKWNDWLARRYTDTKSLAAAWANPSDTAKPVPVIDLASARWVEKIQPGSAAKLKPGNDASAFAVVVEKTSGADWHVQISTRDLRLEDNVVYTVAFEARASTPGKLGVGVSNDLLFRPDEEWRSLGLLEKVDIGKSWMPVRLSFPVHSVAGGRAALSFNVAAQPGTIEIRGLTFFAGATRGGLRPGESLDARTISLPAEPSTPQWADWIHFLADTDRAFAEEMRTFLRDELKVKAPIICSQINFSGLTALDREQSMDFADTHTYWQHPDFPGGDWDRKNWTIRNTPQVSAFGLRRFGVLGELAQHRVAGKPYSVSEYDQAAPSEYACEMYPELAVFACRQNWDAVYAFDLGAYGVENPDGRISSFFDQINHPAKWALAPFATRLFRQGLIPPAEAVAEITPGKPVWGDAMHFDMLWAKLNPERPFDFLDCRLQVNDKPATTGAKINRSGQSDTKPAHIVKAPQGPVLVASGERAAVATGYLGGTTVEAGSLRVSCPRFGRDFATVSAVTLDNKSLATSNRVLVTLVARAENQGMIWNESRTSVSNQWGHGPTIAEYIPATVSLAGVAPRKVFSLAPDGTRKKEIRTATVDGAVRFTASPEDETLHYELVGPN